MACCAFAVFLLMQLLMPFRRLSAALWGSAADDHSLSNPAVDWSPQPSTPGGAATIDTAPALFAATRTKLKRRLVWFVALELGLAAAALGGVAHLQSADAMVSVVRPELALDSLHGVLCGRETAPDSPAAVNSNPRIAAR